MGLFNGKCMSTARLDGKTAIVTGSNTGIGKVTAHDFVKRGARVIMACRDLKKAQEAAEDIRQQTKDLQGAGVVRVVHLDLASLTSVRKCSELLLKTEPAIHLLINNAGIMACPKALTEDGFEMQLGVNHLGHFLFTCLLLPRIIRSAPARIVIVSSLVHQLALNMNFDDLNSEKSYNATLAYAQSKLANVLFAKELGERLKGTGVTTYSLHPGVVATELSRHFSDSYFPGVTWLFNNVARFVIKSPEQGAQTTIYCAVSEEVAEDTGFYYSECRKKMPSGKARNRDIAKRLWEESIRMVQLTDWDPFTAEDKNPPSKPIDIEEEIAAK
ncbi:retinol dehydrogenase 11 [Anabrus simplex]|uniref:retinol dehydrogenase 11 n=1 Tax=Anabrus simplex TaxID=316456 RepID=UPI0035A3C23F